MKIVSAFALQPHHRQLLESAAPGAEIVDRQCSSPEEVLKLAAGGCDVIMTFFVPDDLRKAAPKLHWIQLYSAGADHMSQGPLGGGVVRVTTTSGVHAASMAEFALTMMLMHAHRFNVTSRAQFRHRWINAIEFMSTADVLRGKTAGIIGYGSIGRATARLASAFGMRVLALKRNPSVLIDSGWSPPGVGDPEGKIPERIFSPEEREALLRESDFIIVILPLTNATRRFISARELTAVKPAAFLVNIGRGEVVDQSALIEALETKRIGGAGLDVFEREPLEAGSPLWDMEEVILTPHMAGPFRGYLDLSCELFAENLRRFGDGQTLLNQIDWSLGY